jgi:phosphatidylglycerol---prolipoprotein diacylglyceryl transferase
VQLYESAVMMGGALLLGRMHPGRFQRGDRFRAFLLGYCAWRIVIDFWKPGFRAGGMTVLQWACLIAFLWYARDLWRMLVQGAAQTEGLADG